jgi:hypothetical protein
MTADFVTGWGARVAISEGRIKLIKITTALNENDVRSNVLPYILHTCGSRVAPQRGMRGITLNSKL